MFVHVNEPEYQELKTINIHGQRWYIIPSGVKYASVTTVLSYKEKPWVKEWQQSFGIKKAEKETKRCTDRGDALHEMAEMYLKNIENPTKGHKPEHYKLFNQLKFRLNKINNIRAQEIPLYSDTLKIAGRVDCIAEYNGVLSVIDFKTSSNNKDESMIEDYKLQATAYSLMYHEMFDVQIDNIVVLIAVEKGIMPLSFEDKVDNYIEPLVEKVQDFYKNKQ